jgi:hypothetical protein
MKSEFLHKLLEFICHRQKHKQEQVPCNETRFSTLQQSSSKQKLASSYGPKSNPKLGLQINYLQTKFQQINSSY